MHGQDFQQSVIAHSPEEVEVASLRVSAHYSSAVQLRSSRSLTVANIAETHHKLQVLRAKKRTIASTNQVSSINGFTRHFANKKRFSYRSAGSCKQNIIGLKQIIKVKSHRR